MQTTQTQIAAFMVAAGNAVQYVREDEAVQLSTTVSLRMGFGVENCHSLLCSPAVQRHHVKTCIFWQYNFAKHLPITGAGVSVLVDLCMNRLSRHIVQLHGTVKVRISWQHCSAIGGKANLSL